MCIRDSSEGELAGISGGYYGDNGDDGIEYIGQSSPSSGGESGFAIKSNGNSIVFESGDNTLNVKGRRS